MLKKMKRLIAILIVILVSLIAFFGAFKKENGVWKNEIPDYRYGMDVKGARELRYALDDTEEEKYVYVDETGNIKGEVWKDGSSITAENEETTDLENVEEEIPYAKETRTIKINSDEKLTKENFERAKQIIQKRLKEQDVNEDHIRIDDVTGKLMIESANDNDQTELIQQLVSNPGKFEIVDYQNGIVLMDNSDIKKASVVYSNNASYSTYLQIEFNKEGTQKLKEISTKYIETQKVEESESEEENAEEEEHNHSYVSVVFDDTTMMTTYFGEEMTQGLLQIPVGQATTEYQDFVKNYNAAKIIADMLNSGILPVTYELETDNFVKSEIVSDMENLTKVFFAILVVVPAILYIVKFKKNGVLATILNMGYIASLSLILKFVQVEMTINAMIAGFMIVLMNIAFMKMLLKRLPTQKMGQAYQEVSKKFYLTSIPVIVIAVVFTLTKYYTINSIGMIVFWGIILNVLYNLIFTKTVLKDGEDG